MLSALGQPRIWWCLSQVWVYVFRWQSRRICSEIIKLAQDLFYIHPLPFKLSCKLTSCHISSIFKLMKLILSKRRLAGWWEYCVVWIPSASPPLPMTQLNDMLPLILSSRNFPNMCFEIAAKFQNLKLSINKFFCVTFVFALVKYFGVDFQRAMQWQSVEWSTLRQRSWDEWKPRF